MGRAPHRVCVHLGQLAGDTLKNVIFETWQGFWLNFETTLPYWVNVGQRAARRAEQRPGPLT